MKSWFDKKEGGLLWIIKLIAFFEFIGIAINLLIVASGAFLIAYLISYFVVNKILSN